jgi:hypothetical protein
MQKKIPFIFGTAMFEVAAWTEGSDLERAILGAAIGGAAGEVLEDGKCITGAAIGGAAGALADDI